MCGGDANPAALPLAGWQAVDAIQQVEDQRIQAWRKDNGLTLDEDFAFAFTTYEQAQVMAGGLVADRWVAVRSAASDSMLQEVSAAIHDMRAAPAQAMRRPAPKFKARRPGVRLRPNAEDSPEVVTKRVDALAAIWVTCQVLRPRGRMSVELQASWDESCRRLAQRQVAHAEAVTISNVIKTFHELKAVLDSRGRPLPPEEVDIDHFLYHGTTAPSRALAALKWIVKNGDLGWPLHHASIPTTVSRKRLRSQAPVVAPPMLGHLEDTIVGCCGINDPEWLCLMGSWMVAVGVLRHRHLERSTPRKVTLGFLHAHCSKGKQRRLRSGFDFAIPASFSNGWPWLDHWLRWWKQLDEDLRQRVGLCFHPEGRAFTLSEVQDATQRCFARQVDNEEQLTSYSWRRLLPTVGHTLQMDSIALSSLGDWQERSKQDKDATMALHYSSAKYGASLRSKATALGAMSVLQAFDTWEQITPSAASDAVEAGKKQAQTSISRDNHVVWSVPVTALDMARRFAVSQVLREKAAKRREAAHGAEAIRSMPNHLQGKQLSSFLRDGKLLCGAWQSNRCTRDESACGAAHRCAVMLKSGRVCGGKHQAMVCRDRRALLVTGTPAVPKEEPASPVPSAGAVSEPASAKKKRKKKEGKAFGGVHQACRVTPGGGVTSSKEAETPAVSTFQATCPSRRTTARYSSSG